MTLITLEKITKTFGAQTLFQAIDVSLSEGEKIGLIGVNGTGKSTLLKIINGDETVDQGKITKMRDLRVSHLLQDPIFDEMLTAHEQVKSFLGRDAESYADYEISTMLNHLQIDSHQQMIAHFSGGQRKRIALAATLLKPCDLLLLDEPTNHMDNETIDWLEEYLKRMKCAILMVTHDRYFLNRIVTHIFELSDRTLYRYDGRYETYLENKNTRLIQQASAYKKMKNLYVSELAWIRAGVQARGTKSKSRIQRFEALRENMSQISDEQITIETAFTRLGKKILEIDALAIGYDKALRKPLTYMAKPGDRIGIIGNNGSGKSTLLNTLAGVLPPVEGYFEFGPTVKLAYFTQNPDIDTHTSMRAIDYIKEVAEYVTTKGGYRISAGDIMEQFLFDSNLQYTPIDSLSGGERRRLQLLKLLVDAPNVLLLDEPTNNLDLDTLKALESYLDSFEGIVLCVSHDRYFLDRTCDQLFVFDDLGNIDIQQGNYSDYLNRRPMETSSIASNAESSKTKTERPKSSKKKLSYKETKQLEALPQTIETLEAKLDSLQAEMTANATDFAKIQTLFEMKEATELAYLEALEAYETLLALKESYEH
ncbi:ABC-F family ATP-binding cassette domain-containing protein [Fusibacter paucivorans]|uniref:ABC-F family ATP-binding cassette domain-containing protein n=1 Tax=Fusibacter paucivorans TaxID=76009 RepID=A0ABS5PKP4_9FIRM|nr:ABC-F family ATP-binding cassette domain-containing protein [Fusibacter paucivorans]MBS7525745.1 ABC-F family ATP-binding cassette domain-containing protein [Fusibacter paucivorans]